MQRSSLSHLLSGRNKPSLDFILKILDVFPEVDLYWVLNGKGTFPKSESENDVNIPSPTPIVETPLLETKMEITPDLFSETLPNKKNQVEEKLRISLSNMQNPVLDKTNLEIDRIVIFYKNGTFKTYSQE